jgi:hypothetical protein
MNASFACLDHLQQCSISGRRGVNSVGSNPEILLALVNHFPNFLKELVSIDNEFSVGKLVDGLDVKLAYFSVGGLLVVVGMCENGIDIHVTAIRIKIVSKG